MPGQTAPKPLRTVGRHVELEAMSSLLVEPADESWILVLEGEPGMGKTTLWQDGISIAETRGWHVLRCQPARGERSMSLSAVADIIGGVFDLVSRELPPPQAAVLEELLVRRPLDGPAGPRAQAVAVLGVIEAVARRSPTLVALDDIHYLDAGSARLLTYVLRRLPTGSAAIVTRRVEPYDVRLSRAVHELSDVVTEQAREVRRLGPISVGEVHMLVDRTSGVSLNRPLLTRVHAASAGNPMLALEIVAGLGADPAQQPVSAPLPSSGGLRALVEDRIRRLSPSCRETVLCAALLSRPTEALLHAALESRLDVERALEEAELADVLVTVGDTLRFSHPLLVSAAVSVAPGRAVQRLHGELARLVSDPEERAQHLVHAARQPSEPTAEVIERAARAQLQRGALDSALELSEAAALLTPTDRPTALARRLLVQARAAYGLEDTVRARAAAERSAATAIVPRPEALELLGELDFTDGDMVASCRHFAEAIALVGEDAPQAARLHAQVARSVLLVDLPTAVEHATWVIERDVGTRRVDAEVLGGALIDRFLAQVMLGEPPAAEDLARALDLEAEAAHDHPPHPIPLVWYHFTDDLAAARRRFAWEVRWARDAGWSGLVQDRLGHLAMVELRAGNWQLAEQYADESCSALSVNSSIGPVLMRFVWRSHVDIVRGRLDRARSTLLETATRFDKAGQDWWHAMTLSASAFAEFAAGDHASVDRIVGRKNELLDRLGVAEAPLDRSEPFHVQSLVVLGEIDRAAQALARLELRHRTFPRLWTHAALPRTRALVHAARSDLPAALEALQLNHARARELDDALPFDAAWRWLVEGGILRRAKRRTAAAAALERARFLFTEAGAEAWAKVALDELTRIGLRTAKPSTGLTTAERSVAELAASGLTTREVAAALFMSPKTVEAHLTRVYRSLGIRSRAQLSASLGTSSPTNGSGQT